MVSRLLIRLLWRRSHLGGIGCTFIEYSLVNFFPVYLDLTRRIDPETYLIAFYAHYYNSDIITDDKFLPNPSCQNEHSNLPLVSDTSCVLLLTWFEPFTLCGTKKSQHKEPSLAGDIDIVTQSGHIM